MKMVTITYLLVSLAAVFGQDEGVANPLSCICTDVTPRVGYNKPPTFECFDQQMAGKCEESFMYDTIGELPEGYCQRTCGRCDCCQTLYSLLQENDLSEFLGALMQLGFENWLLNHGWDVTLLAPTNAAFLDGLADMGYSREQAYADSDFLTTIMLYHILPREPYLRAIYTSDFMQDGDKINTYLNDFDTPDQVSITRDAADNIYVNSPVTRAVIQTVDVESCKGSIQVLDSLMTPYQGFPTTRRIRPDTSIIASECTAEGNANYRADTYIGQVNVKDEGGCCQACLEDEVCNTWTFCPKVGGCAAGAQILEQGRCDMKFQAAVDAGEAPLFWEKNDINVPFISGAVYRGQATKSKIGA
eukprot:TRINITY_DN2721_c0_g1_i1.p1 TRINITY_DN2721_c0_g1~~TRINITY_DN2721_c0_g1_i1.p1  ORF type:complete len:359 (+),score=75.26 TRINITY_DN2721_c0_g1_i1:156-1232(+)